MHSFIQHYKLNQLYKLIEMEFTGKPEHLAIILGVTDRTIRRYIEILRDMGADIRYSRAQQTYYAVLSTSYGWNQMIERHFDNEDSKNTNWTKLNGVLKSDNDIYNEVGSGFSLGKNTTLWFQFYTQNTVSGMETFPNLGISYGVLGYFINAPNNDFAKGWISIDDEDTKNANYLLYELRYPDDYDTNLIGNVIEGGRNTKLYMTRVRI